MAQKGVTKARRRDFELQSSELWIAMGQQKRSKRTTSNSIDWF